MSKISIIVPVYNVEDYLDECIQSILKQAHWDIELLLIDDGSKDASGRICDKYGMQDDRVKVIHKENGGVSSARNNGLKLASGDYIAFVDADDYIEPDMFKTLLYLSEEHNTDISISTVFIRNETARNDKTTVLQREDVLNTLLSMHISGEGSIPCTMCDGIYRRELFDGLTFPDDIHHYEDYLMKVMVVNRANNVVSTTHPFYHYRVREDSANHVTINKKILTCLKVADRLVENGVHLLNTQYRDVKSYFIGQCYFKLILSNITERGISNIIKASIKENWFKILNSSSISTIDKIMMISYIITPTLNSKLFGYLLCRHLSDQDS